MSPWDSKNGLFVPNLNPIYCSLWRPRISQRGIYLTLIGVLLLLMLFLFLRPSAGQSELKKELYALQTVNSWKMSMQIGVNGRFIMSRNEEAVCPDRQHIAEYSPDGTAEFTRIGDDVYYRQNNLPWVKGMPGPDLFVALPTPQPCLSDPTQPKSAPNAGAEEMRLSIQNDIDHGNIVEGDEQKINGVTCRMWKVTALSEKGRMGSYSTCIGELDHLPRTIENANHTLNVSFEWNVPVSVQVPDMSPPATNLR
jgi:hypothetical protein